MQTDPPNPEPPKRKRRWFQFSLRSLLIFTLICAIPCALLGRKIEQKRREREAVEAIVKLGGKVWYEYQGSGGEWAAATRQHFAATQIFNLRPGGPVWLRGLLGETFFCEVERVALFLRVENATNAGLANLERIPGLKSLALVANNFNMTDAGLLSIHGLIQLQDLLLGSPNITDSGLENIKELTRLERLALVGGSITDAGLVNLKDLTNLRYLNLSCEKVTDRGLMHLKQLTNLQVLNLSETGVTEAGVKELQKALPRCKIER